MSADTELLQRAERTLTQAINSAQGGTSSPGVDLQLVRADDSVHHVPICRLDFARWAGEELDRTKRVAAIVGAGAGVLGRR